MLLLRRRHWMALRPMPSHLRNYYYIYIYIYIMKLSKYSMVYKAYHSKYSASYGMLVSIVYHSKNSMVYHIKL